MSHTTKLNNVVWESTFDYYGDRKYMVNVAVTHEDGYHVWVWRDAKRTWDAAPCASIEWAIVNKYIDHLRAELSTTMADLEKAQAPALEAFFEPWRGEDAERAVRERLSEAIYWARSDLVVAIQECARLGVSSAQLPAQKEARDRAHDALDTLIEFLSEGETTIDNEPAKRFSTERREYYRTWVGPSFESGRRKAPTKAPCSSCVGENDCSACRTFVCPLCRRRLTWGFGGPAASFCNSCFRDEKARNYEDELPAAKERP